MRISGYRCMWVLAMFDLPTDSKPGAMRVCVVSKTPPRRRVHANAILRLRRHASKENAEVHVRRIKSFPPDGEVRVLLVTDKQFERMLIFWGKMRKKPEAAPKQLGLF